MFDIISICSLVAIILLIWFRTEAYIEYCRLLKLDKISLYEEYDFLKKGDVSLTYLGFLRQYHNNFFTRLITCPICVSVWISLIFSLTWTLSAFNVIMIGGLLLYGIIDRLLG